jgi:hypothetical protein
MWAFVADRRKLVNLALMHSISVGLSAHGPGFVALASDGQWEYELHTGPEDECIAYVQFIAGRIAMHGNLLTAKLKG